MPGLGVIHADMIAKVMCALLMFKTSFLFSRSLMFSCVSFLLNPVLILQTFMELEFSIFWDFSRPSLPSARVPQESFSRCAQGCRVVTLKIPDRSREVEAGMKFQTFFVCRSHEAVDGGWVPSLILRWSRRGEQGRQQDTPRALPHPAFVDFSVPDPSQVISFISDQQNRPRIHFP